LTGAQEDRHEPGVLGTQQPPDNARFRKTDRGQFELTATARQ
jgi:hypothetical protein